MSARTIPPPRMARLTTIDKTPIWASLAAHRRSIEGLRLRDAFASDPERARRFSLRAGNILLDASKNRITDETMRLLRELARAADLPAWISRLFSGAMVNTSEKRPALHTALRRADALMVEGQDVMVAVRATRERMRGFVDAVRSGAWRGQSGA